MNFYFAHTEETPATENNEASEDVKDPQSESKEPSSSENEGNSKEEVPPALVEPSSEAPRGLGLLLFCTVNRLCCAAPPIPQSLKKTY